MIGHLSVLDVVAEQEVRSLLAAAPEPVSGRAVDPYLRVASQFVRQSNRTLYSPPAHQEDSPGLASQMADSFKETDPMIHKSRWLLADIRFNTPSDAKLAGLYLENDFPIRLFQKVFDLIFDPDFKRDDVTFEDMWDLLESVASRRRKLGKRRELGSSGRIESSTSTDSSIQASPVITTVPTVPPLVLELVAEYMADTASPLSIAAMGRSWSDVFRQNGADFWNMSLVHRSWTATAHAHLRRRAVIPYQCLQNFLVSPLCGPWITEIILYWTIDSGPVGIEVGDIWMLEALLSRTTSLRSLALNTFFYGTTAPDDSYVADLRFVFEIIADVAPNLEHLWLNHLPAREDDKRSCEALGSLSAHIPKMTRLTYLSLKRWAGVSDEASKRLDWSVAPPASLKTLELYISSRNPTSSQELEWLMRPREGFQLASLSLFSDEDSQFPDLKPGLVSCAPKLRRLTLCPRPTENQTDGERNVAMRFCRDILPFCVSLRSLHVFGGIFESMFAVRLQAPQLPPSLTDIYLHVVLAWDARGVFYYEETDSKEMIYSTVHVLQPAINLRRVYITHDTFPPGFSPQREMPFLGVGALSMRAETQPIYERAESEKGRLLQLAAPAQRDIDVLEGQGLVPVGWKSGHRFPA